MRLQNVSNCDNIKPILVQYKESALKSLSKIGHDAAARIIAKINAYAANPQALTRQVKRLKSSGYLRLRVGDYRVIFTEQGVIITIIDVGHRKEIYD